MRSIVTHICRILILPCLATSLVFAVDDNWILTFDNPVHHHLANSGGDVGVPLYFNALITDAVLPAENHATALSALLRYDPAVFANPEIVVSPPLGASMPTRHVQGMELAPGVFRLAIYDSPLTSLAPNRPINDDYLGTLKLRVISTASAERTLTFTNESGRDQDGLLLTDVQFSDITVLVNQNAAQDWSLYK